MVTAAQASLTNAGELNGSVKRTRKRNDALKIGNRRAAHRLNSAVGVRTIQNTAISALTYCGIPMEARAVTSAIRIGAPTAINRGPARSNAGELIVVPIRSGVGVPIG